jgi:predicted transcriptional regulator of viral defense system
MPTIRNNPSSNGTGSKPIRQILALARRQGVLRARDMAAIGIPREYLTRLVERGQLERIARGLYRLAEADASEHHTLVQVAKRVPEAVICLLSALRFHSLGTQAPAEVWIAIDPKARRPRFTDLPIRVVRFSGQALEAGTESHTIEGVAVRVTTPAKTVADCFKYRHKIGLDVALEALRDGWRKRRFSLDELWEMARVCRVANVMRPYIEVIV